MALDCQDLLTQQLTIYNNNIREQTTPTVKNQQQNNSRQQATPTGNSQQQNN